ncbi:hypothetical protein [Microbacterium sp. SSM24]|uniref:hypothetical protein n=1 Tax=Microbacterium sp. SSM24 TaxID=2991714 RepID=UPI002226385E|nr:hypothetical protein [Microbacterium sp. SSM24]MCW3493468.1 hypothetical protein [Microbacterium sp. SSM24]
MTKRAKIITALVAAVALVVVTPLAAVAYWVVSTQLAVTAQASTFSIAPYAVAPSSASFTGWEGTQYYAAPLTNNGATPWSGQTVSLAASSGFGAAAVATAQVAFNSASSACQNDATYTSVTPQSALGASSWSSTATVAPAATIYACVKVDITDTDTQTPSGQPAPAPSLTLTTTATAAQRNWTDAESAALTVASTGWAACTNSGSNATLTLPAQVPAGTYTVVRNDTGATFTGTVAANARTTLTLTNPATSGTETAETYVTVKNSSGAVVAVANLTFRSSYVLWIFFTKSLICA